MTRFFDILLSLLSLIVMSPLFLGIMLVLRFTGEKEVFFRQQRVGQNGEYFGILKFATMLKDSPNIGSGTITSKNDPRILPVGRVLRKTKLNEIPQLINIFMGDMSIVGPRPLAPRDLKGVEETVKAQVFLSKPGLSGVGSLFFRSEEKILQKLDNPRPLYDNVIAPYKASLEIWYAENKSFKLYWLIIMLTVVLIFVNKTKLIFWFFNDLPEPPPAIIELFPDIID